MNRYIPALVAALLAMPLAGLAEAQTMAPTSPESAKTQIEASGYTDVRNLRRQEDGSWTARATKSKTEVAVAIDPKGNVTEMSQ